MATVEKRGDKWSVRWRELVVTTDAAGHVSREWKWRRRTVPTKAAANKLSRTVETAASLGERWEDAREIPRATLGAVALAYVGAAVSGGAPIATQKHRSTLTGSFLKWAGEDRPVTDLSLSLLEEYAASLPSEGRKASTRHRKILAAEQMWAWAHDRPEAYPGVPSPRRLTGGPHDADRVRPPPPVVALAAPNWTDLDAMIRCLRLPWHQQLARTLRYTGLRISQVLGLRWGDMDLDRRVLWVRAGRAGAKRSRGRALPMHPALVDELAALRSSRLVEGRATGHLWPRPSNPAESYRPDALLEPFRFAWEESGVARSKWDIPEDEGDAGRAHGSPTHAFRRAVRVGLSRAEVEEALVYYLIGHAQGSTTAAYVPEDNPEESPYWPRLVAGVATIPRWSPTPPPSAAPAPARGGNSPGSDEAAVGGR